MVKKKILVVDDEPSLTELIKLNLEATGNYEVRTENKGRLALAAARTFRPDLIFLDIIMPDMEGSEVARQLQGDEVLKKIPIIFLTATVTVDEVGPSGATIGGQTFIAKPATVKELLGCIQKKIGK